MSETLQQINICGAAVAATDRVVVSEDHRLWAGRSELLCIGPCDVQREATQAPSSVGCVAAEPQLLRSLGNCATLPQGGLRHAAPTRVARARARALGE